MTVDEEQKMYEQQIKENAERKAKNVALLAARQARLGINRPFARSIDELIQIEGKNPLVPSAQIETV